MTTVRYSMNFTSKLRNVYGSVPDHKDQGWDGVPITKNSYEAQYCHANGKYLAVAVHSQGGGAFMVLPTSYHGRVDERFPRFVGHTRPIYDLRWSFFKENLIASASEDSSVRLWEIPEGGIQADCKNHLFNFTGHKKKCVKVEWHPAANDVLMSCAYDKQVIVWNCEKLKAIKSTVLDDSVYDASWNYDGSMAAATTKNKTLYLLDPRQAKPSDSVVAHAGAKCMKVVWMGKGSYICTTGFSRTSERQVSVWDQRNLSEGPIHLEIIDSGPGALYPFFDPDLSILYIAGKGDANIRYYELRNNPPHLVGLNQFSSNNPQRAMGYMIKRHINPMKCEIFRFFKLHANCNYVEPLSMIVPRRPDSGFQEDLYPDTFGPNPALTPEDYEGGTNKDPILIPFTPEEAQQ